VLNILEMAIRIRNVVGQACQMNRVDVIRYLQEHRIREWNFHKVGHRATKLQVVPKPIHRSRRSIVTGTRNSGDTALTNATRYLKGNADHITGFEIDYTFTNLNDFGYAFMSERKGSIEQVSEN